MTSENGFLPEAARRDQAPCLSQIPQASVCCGPQPLSFFKASSGQAGPSQVAAI